MPVPSVALIDMLRKLIVPTTLMVASVLLFNAPAQAEGRLDGDFRARLKSAKLKPEDFGVVIGDVEGQALLTLNADRPMIPASITKLVTAASFLKHYPPGTKFKTQLLSDGAVSGKTLKGDLALKGAGDPAFVSETMWFLVNAFTRSGITTVDGDLIVDDTLFDSMRYDLSRQADRVDRAYDAPTGAMSFNWNSVNIFVRPGAKAGENAKVWLDPENEYVRLQGTVKTSGKGVNVNIDRDFDKKSGQDVIRVSGSISAGASEYVQFKNITSPDLWAGANLRAFLEQRGVKVKGKVVAGKATETAKVLAEAESKPVEQIVTDMNKFSNNYVAEMLTKHLGLLRQKPGTIASGMAVINDDLQALGIGKDQMLLTNPSGLTRDNRITAQAMWKLLKSVETDFQSYPEFVSSLPISGIDGTLKKRMKDDGGERQVRAKTGLLTGVVALAGYGAGKKTGKTLPFVFIYNGNADGALVRSVVDRFVVEKIVNGEELQKVQ